MSQLRPLTRLETLNILIVEATNELTKSEIMQEFYQRKLLIGVPGNQIQQASQMNKMRMKDTQDLLNHMEELKKAELDKQPKFDPTREPEYNKDIVVK